MSNFVSFAAAIAELAHGEKSRTQSITQSLSQSLSLLKDPGTEASENEISGSSQLKHKQERETNKRDRMYYWAAFAGGNYK